MSTTSEASFGAHSRPATGAGALRLAITKQVVRLLRELAHDPASVQRQRHDTAGLFAKNCDPLGKLGSLLVAGSEHTACPHFGLMAGASVALADLGATAAVLGADETLASALVTLTTDLGRDIGAIAAFDTGEDVAVLRFLPYDPNTDGLALLGEAFLAAVTRLMRELFGADWRPSEVLLVRRAPADRRPYGTFFRAPVRFDEEAAGLIISARALSIRRCVPAAALPGAPVPDTAGEQERDVVDVVRQLLRKELLRRSPGSGEVARHLAVHRRTLNRRLRSQGTNFRTIVDEVRFAVARQLVSDTDLPLSHISAVLHFSEPSAFTRAFERWASESPSSLRERIRPH